MEIASNKIKYIAAICTKGSHVFSGLLEYDIEQQKILKSEFFDFRGTLPNYTSEEQCNDVLLIPIKKKHAQNMRNFYDFLRLDYQEIEVAKKKGTTTFVESIPYYFSLKGRADPRMERKKFSATDFAGSDKFQTDPETHGLGINACPKAAIDCVSFALNFLSEIAGIDLTAIHPTLPKLSRSEEVINVIENLNTERSYAIELDADHYVKAARISTPNGVRAVAIYSDDPGNQAEFNIPQIFKHIEENNNRRLLSEVALMPPIRSNASSLAI